MERTQRDKGSPSSEFYLDDDVVFSLPRGLAWVHFILTHHLTTLDLRAIDKHESSDFMAEEPLHGAPLDDSHLKPTARDDDGNSSGSSQTITPAKAGILSLVTATKDTSIIDRPGEETRVSSTTADIDNWMKQTILEDHDDQIHGFTASDVADEANPATLQDQGDDETLRMPFTESPGELETLDDTFAPSIMALLEMGLPVCITEKDMDRLVKLSPGPEWDEFKVSVRLRGQISDGSSDQAITAILDSWEAKVSIRERMQLPGGEFHEEVAPSPSAEPPHTPRDPSSLRKSLSYREVSDPEGRVEQE